MPKTIEPASANGQQGIDRLAERFKNLNEEKIRSDTELKAAEQRLNELKDEARRQYGTDDLAELQRKLQQMKAENEERRRKYQAELDKIENDLKAVEASFAEAGQEPA